MLLVFRRQDENDDVDMSATKDPVEETNTKKDLDELVIISDVLKKLFSLFWVP